MLGVAILARLRCLATHSRSPCSARAYYHDPAAIGRRKQTYPAAARHAKAGDTKVLSCDQTVFQADAAHGRYRDIRGQIPELTRPGQQQPISAASAMNGKNGF